MDPLTAVKRHFCPHDEDGLRFLFVSNRSKRTAEFWYECTKCGKRISKYRPINCEGCVSICSDESGVHCLEDEIIEKSCLECERQYFMPIKIDD